MEQNASDKPVCGGGVMAPKYDRVLIPETSEYVTLGSKREFSDVTKVMDMDTGRLFWWVSFKSRGQLRSERSDHRRKVRGEGRC